MRGGRVAFMASFADGKIQAFVGRPSLARRMIWSR